MKPDGFDALMQLMEEAGCLIKRGAQISIGDRQRDAKGHRKAVVQVFDHGIPFLEIPCGDI